MTEAGRAQRVLVLATTGKDGDITCKVLENAGVGCLACRDVEQLLAEMEMGLGCLLIAEETLTPGCVDRLAQWISDQPSWSDLPVLLLTSAGASSPKLIRPIQTLGNVTLLERPVRTLALISATGSALRARKRQYGVKEADQRKDEFLASLGHELRNPLAPIRTSVGVLERVHPDSPDIQNICGVIERQVKHLTRLVDDLLDVARITRGKVVLQRAATSLAAVINQAVEMCAVLANNAHHKIEVALPAEKVPLVADQARLVQSVANVLANAIKFTPSPGTISLRATAQNGSVVIRVKDSGIGLEAQALTSIFDLFTQAEAGAGQIKAGLGIGLSLARQFIGMHGGSIRAESAGPGLGSEFVMTIPRAVAVSSDEKSVRTLPQSTADATPVKVLVVDDNRDAADMLQVLFQSYGFTVASAYNGVEALEEVARFAPDAVVMDLGMPGLDGYEAARRMRARPDGKEMVLIALTGWGQEGTRKKALEAGFDFHVVKPVDIEVLKGFIAQSRFTGAASTA